MLTASPEGQATSSPPEREYCALCGKNRRQVKKLILGMRGGVCLPCVELCNEIIRQSAEVEPKQASERLQTWLREEPD